MTRRTFLSMMMLSLATLTVNAKPIGRNEAFQIATKSISGIHRVSKLAPFYFGEEVTRLTFPAFYAYNAGDGRGFVIVTGDDEFPSVVGYSTESSLSAGESLPEGLVDFLNAYTEYVEAVRAGVADAPKRSYNGDITGQVAVPTLMTSLWSQESPYNLYCPAGTPVGCVATAMTQIMNFWKYPAHSKGSISYNSSQGYLNVVLDDVGDYDWSLIKDVYSPIETKKATGKMVAKLCYHAGMACRMSYASGGSGSYIPDAFDGFVKNFCYDGEALSFYIRDCMANKNQWDRILYTELRAGRPVLYAGSSANAGGHAFVLDGYDTNAYVHVNWGWGGSFNGYYDVTLLDCGNYKFSENQQMIVGIIPDPDGLHTQRKQFPMRMYDVTGYTATNPTVAVTEKFDLTIGGIYNISPYGTSYEIAIGLFDLKGNLIETVNEKEQVVTLGSKYGYNSYGRIDCKLKNVPADGDYIFSVVTKENGFSDFVLPFTNGGDICNRFHAYIHNGYIYFNQTSPGYVEPTEEPFEIDLTPAALPGDVNGDGTVDINDVVAVINHIAGTASYDRANVNGDTDSDGKPLVDINDVVAVINIMAN